MNTLHSSLYAGALISCVLSLFALRGREWKTQLGAAFLFVLLTVLTLIFAFEWLMSNPATPLKVLWLALVMGLAFFLGPCLWLFARSIDEPSPPRLRDLPPVHGRVIVAGLLLLLPLIERTHLGSDFAHPTRGVNAFYKVVVHGTMLLAVALFAVQAFFYLRASLAILRRHSRAAKSLLSDLEDPELDTLRLLIFVVGAHWAVGIARTLHCLLLGKDAGYIVLFAIAEVMITLWAMISLVRGTITVEPSDRDLADDVDDARYARSALDEPARARIARKLEAAWKTHRLHLDSRLTLRKLCAHLRESPHYVSQFINQDLGTNFYDLVNRQRIAAARDALSLHPRRPVLEIAQQVGFNSKSTFNAAFRLHAGMTPSEFRRERANPGCQTASEPTG